MQSIKTKTLVLPSKTDLYFPPEDSEYEVANMTPGMGQLKVFPSIWGHWAGGPGDSKEDVKWLDDHLKGFLEEAPASDTADAAETKAAVALVDDLPPALEEKLYV
ncbi:MAG: hypothetical protein Q9187_006413 [Circinaria calcarea]